MVRARTAAVGLFLLCVAASAEAQTLRGSRTSMNRQNTVARQHDYSFIQTATQVRRFVDLGLLQRLSGNRDYELANVSFPYARDGVKTFVERLAGQYHNACGEKLVVTSLTRPESKQPRNASNLSVHPAGMAVDLRASNRRSCRKWLESTLLSLEKNGVIDATRENYPPHYHVAVFPQPYLRYVARVASPGESRVLAAIEQATTPTQPSTRLTSANLAPAPASKAAASVAPYKVGRGDSLWSIARRHNTTVDQLKALNQLRGTRIVVGQMISVPAP